MKCANGSSGQRILARKANHLAARNAAQSTKGPDPHITARVLNKRLDAIASQAVTRGVAIQLAAAVMFDAVEQSAHPQSAVAVLVNRAAAGRAFFTGDKTGPVVPETVCVVGAQPQCSVCALVQ